MSSKTNLKISDVILFPGKSCYPFTEGKGNDDSKGTATVRSDDQLIKILELIGIQPQENQSFLKDPAAVDYLNLIQKNVQVKSSIEEKFKEVNPSFIELLKGMLVFDPAQRWTARKCLDHPLFEGLRD